MPDPTHTPQQVLTAAYCAEFKELLDSLDALPPSPTPKLQALLTGPTVFDKTQ